MDGSTKQFIKGVPHIKGVVLWAYKKRNTSIYDHTKIKLFILGKITDLQHFVFCLFFITINYYYFQSQLSIKDNKYHASLYTVIIL